MRSTDTSKQLFKIIEQNLSEVVTNWIDDSITHVIATKSIKDLYLTYSLVTNKITAGKIDHYPEDSPLSIFLRERGADSWELTRIYLLLRVLEEDHEYYSSKVANLIEIADRNELETFLKYLILLPQAQHYKPTAVEALRTNMATVFDAIALKNPYPSKYFNEQEWNQMFLKAAFMQRNLLEIEEVDLRANKDLCRIISDYAHERWAASRDIDPLFWRPVTNFLEGILLEDMKRLLGSDHVYDRKAATLCCYFSNIVEANKLIENYPEFLDLVKNNSLQWNNLKE